MTTEEQTEHRQQLAKEFKTLKEKHDIVKSTVFKALYEQLKNADPAERPKLGKAINQLRQEFEQKAKEHEATEAAAAVKPIDITAPFDSNTPVAKRPHLLTADNGSQHPLSTERDIVASIFERMGFAVLDSRELDDDYHMFTSLNFPEGHPARDDYDTFVTEEGLIAPAHTSTMQNRILHQFEPPIQAVIIGRCFRNEDLDAKHEHTLNQIEGVYVDKNLTVGNLLATLTAFLRSYYGRNIKTRIQPAYFPFVEPGFEFAASCPFCDAKGCVTCKHEGWIELGGCGMMHPNVLKEGGIDATQYSGFAWGFGLDRLAMMKHSIEDVRYFQSGKLAFLKQF